MKYLTFNWVNASVIGQHDGQPDKFSRSRNEYDGECASKKKFPTQPSIRLGSSNLLLSHARPFASKKIAYHKKETVIDETISVDEVA